MNFLIVPYEASLGAREVNDIRLALLGMALFFIVSIAGIVIVFHSRYRNRKQFRPIGPRAPTILEIAWTAIPAFIAFCYFAVAASLYFRQRHPAADAMEIQVVGKQWMWKLQHSHGKCEINELHLPAGIPVKLTMTSQDVIHCFFVPAFRVKQDVVPGRNTTMWMVPSRVGAYYLFCTQNCGVDHARMIGKVVVMSRPEYQRWLSAGEPAENAVGRGAALVRQFGPGVSTAPSRLPQANP